MREAGPSDRCSVGEQLARQANACGRHSGTRMQRSRQAWTGACVRARVGFVRAQACAGVCVRVLEH
eukprot:6189751-Pleurochrysis_carterae.AAC.1